MTASTDLAESASFGSSIHLLQVFLNADHYPDAKIVLYMLLHLTFVVSALLLAFVDRVSSKTKDPKQP